MRELYLSLELMWYHRTAGSGTNWGSESGAHDIKRPPVRAVDVHGLSHIQGAAYRHPGLSEEAAVPCKHALQDKALDTLEIVDEVIAGSKRTGGADPRGQKLTEPTAVEIEALALEFERELQEADGILKEVPGQDDGVAMSVR